MLFTIYYLLFTIYYLLSLFVVVIKIATFPHVLVHVPEQILVSR